MRRPQISEAAVVGVASAQWGQKVAAIVVLHPDHAKSGRGGKTWSVMDMRRALKDRLANYKIPQELKVLESIPKNAMGKGKPALYFPCKSMSSHAVKSGDIADARSMDSEQEKSGEGGLRG